VKLSDDMLAALRVARLVGYVCAGSWVGKVVGFERVKKSTLDALARRGFLVKSDSGEEYFYVEKAQP